MLRPIASPTARNRSIGSAGQSALDGQPALAIPRCTGHIDLIANLGGPAEQLQHEPGYGLGVGTSGRQLETCGGERGHTPRPTRRVAHPASAAATEHGRRAQLAPTQHDANPA
jgi:hypothetical protein